MDEPCEENLFSECFNHLLYNFILVEMKSFEIIFVGYLDTIDPLSHQYSFARKLIENFRHTHICFSKPSKPIFCLSSILSLNSEVNLFLKVFLYWFCKLHQREIECFLQNPKDHRMHHHIIPELPSNIWLLNFNSHLSTIL
jgi:hypothetical protein